jgi:glycosyltransferase involved in cell wall biosynthesis
VVLAYFRSLRDRIDLALVTGEEGYLADEARALGVAVFVVPQLVPEIAPRLDWLAVRALREIIRGYRPDLVHAHSSKAGLLGRIAASLAGVPSVFTAHGFAFTENASVPRRVIAMASEWIAAKVGRAVITVSNYDNELGVRCRVLAPGEAHVIHNGIPDVHSRATPGTGSQVNIVMVARFAAPKDHECLLRALSGLAEPFTLWLIGGGPRLPEARTETVGLGISDRVVFMGSRSDVPELLAKAHIFALVSNYEGLPISILEAMRAGLPVVATDVGGVRECVRHNENGFLVPRANVENLRAKLRELIVSPSLREQMGQAGRKLFQKQFTEADMIQKSIEVYQSVLRASRPKPGMRVDTEWTKQPTDNNYREESVAMRSLPPNTPPIETSPSL